jgi:hypothetical protein
VDCLYRFGVRHNDTGNSAFAQFKLRRQKVKKPILSDYESTEVTTQGGEQPNACEVLICVAVVLHIIATAAVISLAVWWLR